MESEQSFTSFLSGTAHCAVDKCVEGLMEGIGGKDWMFYGKHTENTTAFLNYFKLNLLLYCYW